MGAFFWISVLCVLSFVAGFCVFSWLDLVKTKRAAQATSGPVPDETTSNAPPETSLKDPVTHLYNKKHLLGRLEENMARCNRTKERMAVIVWDIDGFVGFNNQFGQDEGDRLLRKVTEVIQRSVRTYDEIFRSGPDEFCAILIPANDSIASEVTERVGHAISHDLFEPGTEYAARHFSISSGLVFYPGKEDVPEALLHAAGQALYQERKTKTVAQ
jgi:diguanylate cyclase (GGDEF)-like protein